MKIILILATVFAFIHNGDGLECKKENILGFSMEFQCPGPYDEPDEVFCCGFGDDKECCNNLISDEDLGKLIDSIPTILGILAGVIFAVILLCIVCCCCCPFCFMYKKRQRGAVHNPSPVAVNVDTSAMQPLQQNPNMMPPQQGYPQQQQQQQQYPPQQGYPPQQPYPPQQGFPQQPYPPPQGYPQQAYPPPQGDQPPPYPADNKQPAFNPNYGQ